jgi:hypothetical protein
VKCARSKTEPSQSNLSSPPLSAQSRASLCHASDLSPAVGVGDADGGIAALLAEAVPDNFATLVAVVDRVVNELAVVRVLAGSLNSSLEGGLVVCCVFSVSKLMLYVSRAKKLDWENLPNSALVRVQPQTS